jgi:hypothetical protein
MPWVASAREDARDRGPGQRKLPLFSAAKLYAPFYVAQRVDMK